MLAFSKCGKKFEFRTTLKNETAMRKSAFLLLMGSFTVSQAFLPPKLPAAQVDDQSLWHRSELANPMTDRLATMTAATKRRNFFFATTSAALVLLTPRKAGAEDDLGLDPSFQLKRRESMKGVLFNEDLYAKFGKVPPPTIGLSPPGGMPFVPATRRYSGYKKFASRVEAGLSLYNGDLKAAVDSADWVTLSALTARSSKGVPGSAASDLPLVLGLFANFLVQSENEGATNAGFLCHSYANELSFAVDDLGAASSARDKVGALKAWRIGREYIDAYLSFVNPAISDKVGKKFDLLLSGRVVTAANSQPAEGSAAGGDPDPCRVTGRYLECRTSRSN